MAEPSIDYIIKWVREYLATGKSSGPLVVSVSPDVLKQLPPDVQAFLTSKATKI